MTYDAIRRAAHAVVMPEARTVAWQPWMEAFFAAGGCTLLLGQTVEEYRAHALDPQRLKTETEGDIVALKRLSEAAGGSAVMLAIDVELGALQRLQAFLEPLPDADDASRMSTGALEGVAQAIAGQARALGVTCFLGPVLDVLFGENSWLQGRTMSQDVDEVSRVGAALIRGFQAGGVAATAKHFPGQARLAQNPIEQVVTLDLGSAELDSALAPFRAAVQSGVDLVMAGPAPVSAWDPHNPPATSRRTLEILRDQLHFPGVIITGDLDAASTLRGRTPRDVAVEAIAAGTQLLLIPDFDDVQQIVETLVDAATRDADFHRQLSAAEQAVHVLVESRAA